MRYAELHARTNFSFLDGACRPEEMVEQALAVGLPALAITDRDGLYGVVEARQALLEACGLERRDDERRARMKLLYGSEVTFDDDVAVALVAEREGWAHLAGTLTQGRLAAPKGEFRLSFAAFVARPGGLFVLGGGPRSAAMRHLTRGDRAGALRRLGALRDAFGARFFVELVRHLAPGDRERSLAMAEIASALGVPVVASNDVCMHRPERKALHDVLRCVAGGFPLSEAGRRLLPNAEPHLKTPAAMAALFADLPHAVENAAAIADAVTFRLADVTYSYPPPDLPPGVDADAHLRRLSYDGLRTRLGDEAPRHDARLDKELSLIAELRYAGYFLTMFDVVQECRRRDILCQGRGSAANSLVCYALGITSVHPKDIDMLFERFISRERNEPPDIDLDIEHERREEIIQHVYGKFGRDHAGMVSEVIRYRWRSSVRDVGRALGFPEAQLARMARFLTHDFAHLDAAALASCGVDLRDPAVARLMGHLLEMARAMEGMPRHLSIHVGGFVLSDAPLGEIVPIENGRMDERTVIQWNKDDVEGMGLFKLDLLGLGMLTLLGKAFRLLAAHHGVHLGLETVPPDDEATYRMLRRADTVGVFQVESRAQMNMLPRLLPTTFYDLVVQVAIVRPGPIQGKMVHPYLRRRRGDEEVSYPHPKLREILGRTLGVPLFQEQVMRLAEAVGGYTPGQADQLRRDMASWKAAGRLERHRERLLAGMERNGMRREFAERVYEQIQGFGSYGFPESHAAAFAHLAYVSAYLKCHFAVPFACALLNAQPMGFYSATVIVNDLKNHGHAVRRVDVQRSAWDATIEDGVLRLGLRQVKHLGERAGRAIERARLAGGGFTSVEDLVHRAALPRRALVPLAAAGALGDLAPHRRGAIWKAAALARPLGPLFSGVDEGESTPLLPPLSEGETMALDVRTTGAFPDRHPMELVRARLDRAGVLRACDLLDEKLDLRRPVTVAGLVITRQRPETARGMVFMTLEDETGHANVALRPDVFLKHQTVARLSGALVVSGPIVADGLARTVSATHLEPLLIEDSTLAIESHDFR